MNDELFFFPISETDYQFFTLKEYNKRMENIKDRKHHMYYYVKKKYPELSFNEGLKRLCWEGFKPQEEKNGKL